MQKAKAMRAAATRRRTTRRTVKEEWGKGYRLMMEQRNMEAAIVEKSDNAHEPQYAVSCNALGKHTGFIRPALGFPPSAVRRTHIVQCTSAERMSYVIVM